jgi:hypothetical protein
MSQVVLILGLVLLPLAVLAPGVACFSQRFVLVFLVWLMLASQLKNRSLCAFVCYLTVHQAYISIGWFFGLATETQHALSLRAANYTMIGVLVYYLVTQIDIPFKWVANAICVSALIQVVLCLLQGVWSFDAVMRFLALYKNNVSSRLAGDVMLGTLGNPNFVGGFFAVSLAFFFRPYWKWCVPVIAALLLGIRSEGAIISAVAAVIVFSRQWWLFMVLPVCVVLYLVWKQDFSVNPVTYLGTRPENWGIAWGKITSCWETTLFGMGYGKHNSLYPIHNEYLSVWFRWGLVGLIPILGFLWNLPRRNIILTAAIVALLVNALASYPMRIPPIAFLGCAIFGLMSNERMNEG